MPRNYIDKILKIFGLKVIKIKNLNRLYSYLDSHKLLTLILFFRPSIAVKVIEFSNESNSELMQDLFVLGLLDFKQFGYFVEFGATDGLSASNTYLLEKNFGWNGILAEPAVYFHKTLRKNRNVSINYSCIWKESGEKLEFNESIVPTFSTLNKFEKSSINKGVFKGSNKYKVETLTLNDLLEIENAPEEIDYISIDTEGSEFEILNAFNFQKYKVKIFTIEHNYSNNRKLIFDLMTFNGYERVLENVSNYDDWYVRRDLIKNHDA